MSALRIAIRILLGWVFLRAGVDVLRNPEPRVSVSTWLLEELHARIPLLPRDDVLLVRANALVQMLAAVMLALGREPRLAALVLAASLVPTTLGGHAYWRHDEPARRAQQEIHFNKNLAILGGLLAAALLSDPPRRRRRRWR
jgi:uncharacterized membrane protein YphA (DoxX/SURF4 family)